MLTRREFFVAAGGFLAAPLTTPYVRACFANDLDREAPWICATPVFVTPTDKRLLSSFSVNEAFKFVSSGDLVFNKAAGFGEDIDLMIKGIQQLGKDIDAWRRGDGLPGSTPEKIVIGIGFLDGSEWQRNEVRETVKAWTDDSRVPFEFDFENGNGRHIRISFSENNSSEIGRQALTITQRFEPTMRLVSVSEDKTAKRRRSVVLHEFGHALGLRHEHRHPQSGIIWEDKEVLMRLLQGAGWRKKDIRENIFEGLDVTYVCKGAPEFDAKSIMIYPIREEWTKNGFSAAAPSEISDFDFQCVESLYP